MRAIDLVAGRCIAFHPALVAITGSITSALMLSQALYWTRRVSEDADGWFHKTQAEWQRETGMTRCEQEAARKALSRLANVWDEKHDRLAHKLWFRVGVDGLNAMLESLPDDGTPSLMRETSIRLI